jgi:ribosomal protein S18 acetylase RimI-like enzyme
MVNELTIRPATLDDLEQLLVFEQGVIQAERPFDPTLKDHPVHYYDLEKMIDAEHIELAVAELAGKLVASGYARIEESKPYLKHSKHAYLGFMYVIPSHRGEGINKQIIEYLRRWSLAKQITEMRLDVYSDNQSAISAYQKVGFTKLMVQMRLAL